MITLRSALCTTAAIALVATSSAVPPAIVLAQDVASVPDAEPAPAALSEDDLRILVARIALYPDDLVALISTASLYPLQIVEASRFLDTAKSKPDQKPKDSWDGSVISLLNYPDIVKMMSDDLEWTQDLGTALAYQQKDVLLTIQQLRDEAVAKGVIKTDDKITVVNEGDNVVIQSASNDSVYIPQYSPEMLYEPDYVPVPVSYYPDPYPYYYSPAAPYFAGFVTGAVWGAAMDWNDWGVWGGNFRGDINVNCDHCFNNINGKVNINDVDWRHVDRSKVSIDRSQFTAAKRNDIRTSIKSNETNSVRTRAATVKRDSAATTRAARVNDVRTSAHTKGAVIGGETKRPGRDAQRPNAGKPNLSGATQHRPAAKPKPGARADARPKKPSALGEVRSGKHAQAQSSRGRQAMGGAGSGRPHKSVSRGGGGGHHAGGRGGGRRR